MLIKRFLHNLLYHLLSPFTSNSMSEVTCCSFEYFVGIFTSFSCTVCARVTGADCTYSLSRSNYRATKLEHQINSFRVITLSAVPSLSDLRTAHLSGMIHLLLKNTPPQQLFLFLFGKQKPAHYIFKELHSALEALVLRLSLTHWLTYCPMNDTIPRTVSTLKFQDVKYKMTQM